MLQLALGLSLTLYIVSAAVGSVPDAPPPSPGLCGACAHAKVPPVIGLAYDKARKALLTAGWKPRRTRLRDGTVKGVGEDLYGNAGAFWSRGYIEVGECAGTGLAQCEFTFADSTGNRLLVTTAGEETESDHAGVSDTRLRCRK